MISGDRASAEVPLRRTADAAPARRWALLAQALLFGLGYLIAAQLGHWLSIDPSHFATFWAPSGLYVGVLLRVERRHWPLFAAAAVLPGVVSHALLYAHPLPVSFGFAVANTLEALLAAAVLRRFWFRGRSAGFATLGDVLALTIVAALAAPLIGAGAGAAVAALGFGAPFLPTWAVLWSIHVVGVLLVAPIVLVFPPLDRLRLSWGAVPLGRRIEAAAMLATVAAYSVVLFDMSPSGVSDGALAFPVLLWPALRFGPRGVAAAVAAMAVIATRSTALGQGPFADPAYDVAAMQVVLLQAFLGIAAVSAHILAVGTDEKRNVLARLAAFNTELETRVAVRTAELAAANAALRRLNETLEHRIADAVAEREAALRQLAQAQKMEAVGQLTGGVAHDFNNLLTAVLGNLDLLEKRVAGHETATKLLAAARLAAERGATLTAQLLAFSRKQHLRPKPTDVNELVVGMGNLLQHTISGTVDVERELASAPWPVLVDPSQIELAVLNLSINARDAMPVGGTVTIRTANVPVGHAEAPKTLAAGDYVMISVADTGTGMSEAVLAKVFEPFFTTKEVGKGSGLGLSMVLGIAQQHGGGVEIASRVGRGTTVRLYLPRAPAEEQNRPAEIEAATAPLGATRAGRLLVVDDDPDVREFTVECLRGLGHHVVAAESGRAALDIVEADHTIELALIDLAMPGMSGPHFAAAARRRRPSLRALFMTGYADTSLLPDAPDAAVLKKPFRVSELAARIAEALARDVPAAPANVAAMRR